MNFNDVLFAKQLANQNSGGNVDLSDYYTKSQTDGLISEKVAEIVANAPDDFDTLKEISDWIKNHEDSAAAMNTAILANTTAITTKVDKVTGKGLSTNDFTNALKIKLNSLENYDDTAVKTDISTALSKTALNQSALGYQRKNILKLTVPPSSKNGVSFSINNGVVTLSGTATANVDCYFPEYPYNVTESDTWINITDTSILSSYGTLDTLRVAYYAPDVEHIFSNLTFRNVTNNNLLTLQKGSVIAGLYIAIISGVSYDGKTLSAMLRYADISDNTYEPYRPSLQEKIDNKIIVLDSMEEFENLTNKTADFYFIKEG